MLSCDVSELFSFHPCAGMFCNVCPLSHNMAKIRANYGSGNYYVVNLGACLYVWLYYCTICWTFAARPPNGSKLMPPTYNEFITGSWHVMRWLLSLRLLFFLMRRFKLSNKSVCSIQLNATRHTTCETSM